MQDKELLEKILQAIVSQPDSVRVERTTGERGVLLMARVAKGDAGAVIGKGGGTIDLIRQLMRIVGTVHNSNIHVELDVPPKPCFGGGGPAREGHYPFRDPLKGFASEYPGEYKPPERSKE